VRNPSAFIGEAVGLRTQQPSPARTPILPTFRIILLE
jgi:hypothetical protein